MTIIKDGSGKGNTAKVDSSLRMHTLSISKPNSERATAVGDSYNINTGVIGLTSTTASGVLYLKNNETRDLIIEALAVGVDSAGTTTSMTEVTVIRNPTAGTLISGATAVDMNANRNFGSSNALASTSLAYKGAEGDTFTNGTDIALFLQQPGTRGYYAIDMELEKGSSIGIKMDTDTSGGTTNVYVALILHRIDGKNINA